MTNFVRKWTPFAKRTVQSENFLGLSSKTLFVGCLQRDFSVLGTSFCYLDNKIFVCVCISSSETYHMIKISLQREPGGSPHCCSPRGGHQVIKIYNLRIEAYTSDVTEILAGLLADWLVAECFKNSQLAQMQFEDSSWVQLVYLLKKCVYLI